MLHLQLRLLLLHGGAYGELVFSTIPGATEGADATESMRIDASGNVGIGTSSPRSLINASSATGAILTLESSDTTLGEDDVVGQINFYANAFFNKLNRQQSIH